MLVIPFKSFPLNKILIPVFRDQERLSGLSILQCALSLSFFNQLPVSLIKQIFSIEFMDKLDTELANCYSKVSIWIVVIIKIHKLFYVLTDVETYKRSAKFDIIELEPVLKSYLHKPLFYIFHPKSLQSKFEIYIEPRTQKRSSKVLAFSKTTIVLSGCNSWLTSNSGSEKLFTASILSV